MSCPTVIKIATPGPPGPAGPTGPAGVGAAWRQGADAPSSGTGSLGDFYLNTSNGDIYGPKGSGGWGSVIFNIAQGQTGPQGPTGATGATGPAGPAGRTVLSGSGAPSSGTGANGDFFVDTTGWVIYGPKANGAWPGGASLIGPTGATGATGPQGAAGPTGPAGTPAAYSDATPQPLGTAAPGTAAAAARADHVHALPTAAAIGAVATSDTRLSDSREWSAATVSQVEAEAGVGTTRRAWTAERVFQAIAAWWGASSAAAKLAGIASGATANATDAQLRDRSTHTGTQSAGTITGLATVATSGAYSDLSGRPDLTLKADLVNGTVPAAQLPSFVDDVIEAANLAAFPGTGESGKIYVALDSNKTYRWSGSVYVEISASPGSTDVVTEGSNNLYFTNARARGAISASGSLSYNSTTGVLSYTAPTPFDPASPGAIGGTTAAAGSFTALTASTRLGLPSGAPASPAARDLYAVSNTLCYRDSGGGERLLLNASDNLANLASAATARTNLGLGSAATAASGDFLPTTFTAGTITYGATTDLDMATLAGGYRTLSLTGNITFTTSNRASGRTVVIRLICDSTQRTLTFPAGWVFVGSKPANIAASKTAVLSLTFFGTADTDCVAAYGVQA